MAYVARLVELIGAAPLVRLMTLRAVVRSSPRRRAHFRGETGRGGLAACRAGPSAEPFVPEPGGREQAATPSVTHAPHRPPASLDGIGPPSPRASTLSRIDPGLLAKTDPPPGDERARWAGHIEAACAGWTAPGHVPPEPRRVKPLSWELAARRGARHEVSRQSGGPPSVLGARQRPAQLTAERCLGGSPLRSAHSSPRRATRGARAARPRRRGRHAT